MSSAAFRTCPICGSRNKLKWEFCARCGESLQEVAPDTDLAAPTTSSEEAEPADEGQGFRIPTSSILAVVAVAIGLYAYGQRDTAAVEPRLFSIPTQPAGPHPMPVPATVSAAEKAFQRGRELLGQGRAQEALPLLAEAVSEMGENALYRAYYGKALFLTGNRDDAIRQFQASTQLAPESAEYRADLARTLVAVGRRDEAVREYARILSAFPDHTEALRTLARLKVEEGNAQEGVVLLQRAQGLLAGDPTVVQELGYALEQAGNLDDAGAYYSTILSRMPDAQITRGRMAEVLFKQQRTAQAAEVLRDGLSRDPNSPLLHRMLGSILDRSGRPSEAAAEYRAYARLAPNAEDAKGLDERAAALERRQTAQR